MIDLHMHSHYSSDGELTPQELVNMCAEKGIDLMSIADHNCVRANEEAMKEAQKRGITYIPGIEIDCTYEGVNFHMLGYGMDFYSPDFAEIENNLKRQGRSASLDMLEKTRELGFDLTEEEMSELSKDNYWSETWTGEMFAEVLLAKPEYVDHPILRPYRTGGTRSDNPYVNFYWDFYSQGKPCYVEIHYPDMQDIVDIIHKNHGSAVLAHPCVNLKGKEELLNGIIDLGIDGIEAYSSYHSAEQCEAIVSKAEKHELMITCGSDFHGKTKPSITLGQHGCRISEEKMKKSLKYVSFS